MRYLIWIVMVCLTMMVVYYAGAQQRPQSMNLKQAWEVVKAEKGVLIFPDKDNPFFSYSINQKIHPNAHIVRVGDDYVVVQRDHSVSSYYQLTIPFNQIHIRRER